MRASAVYLEAARRIDDGRDTFSCYAINAVNWWDNYHSDLFIKLFKPRRGAFGLWGQEWGDDDKTRRSCRVLALCFMAAIAEDEEP
ncbi:MAG: hypothetical protein FJX76_01575 [Armatimonadetes bacterium]|nr:hypothetical protein [Armatimonadota bacterium]